MRKKSNDNKIDKYNEYFPFLLRELMENNKITQDELAEYVGVSRQAIAQYKDGKTNPDIYTFQKIVKYFNEEKRARFIY